MLYKLKIIDLLNNRIVILSNENSRVLRLSTLISLNDLQNFYRPDLKERPLLAVLANLSAAYEESQFHPFLGSSLDF